MDDKELAELQDPNTWESGPGVIQPSVKSPRAIVSVAFSRDDFPLVAEAARARGMKTSEFIRTAALQLATEQQPETIVYSVSGDVRTEYPSHPLRGTRLPYESDTNLSGSRGTS